MSHHRSAHLRCECNRLGVEVTSRKDHHHGVDSGPLEGLEYLHHRVLAAIAALCKGKNEEPDVVVEFEVTHAGRQGAPVGDGTESDDLAASFADLFVEVGKRIDQYFVGDDRDRAGVTADQGPGVPDGSGDHCHHG